MAIHDLTRNQTIVPHCNGTLRLVGCSASVLSPYFQFTGMRKIGHPIRDIRFIPVFMALKAIYGGLQTDSPFMAATMSIVDDSTGHTLYSILIDIDATTFSDAPTLKAAIIAQTVAWSTSVSLGIGTGDVIFPFDAATPALNYSESTVSLSVQTSTGAVGTQISSTKNALVFVSENISTTASISGNAADDLVVEVAPTNSATAGDWVEKARGGQSQALSLAITLQSVQIIKGVLAVFVPAGYYIKVRSLGSSGTFSNGVSNTRVLLLP